jgi:hypothetical protein
MISQYCKSTDKTYNVHRAKTCQPCTDCQPRKTHLCDGGVDHALLAKLVE